MRYEDLKLDTTAELRRIVEFIGLVASETQIAAAVEQASFSNMRQIEEDSGHPRRKAFSGRFVRQGQSHGWEGAYGDQERAVFKARENEALLRLGYADTADW